MSHKHEEADLPPIRALIVDDAPLMRKVIRQILTDGNGIEVAGAASHGQECLARIPEIKPDVITLDIDMPVMNGITAVKNIMVRHQIPIVIISSLVQDGYFAFEALRLGVMDFIPKPSKLLGGSWTDEEELIRMRVRAASGMQVQRMKRVKRTKSGVRNDSDLAGMVPPYVIAIGTTLAGPNTVMHIVTKLSGQFPGAIIALQEIHPRVLSPFCSYFNEISPIEVIPLEDSAPLLPNKIYMGTTFNGAVVEESPNAPYGLEVRVTNPVNHPIDQLFESTAHHLGEKACGVLLTGIGMDGAAGMRKIKEQGGITIAQEQDCCVYPNLVEHALRERVVSSVMSNMEIAQWINSL